MSFENLIEDLRKESRRDRGKAREAAEELGRVGDASIIPELEWAKENHSDKDTRSLAEAAIKQIRDREVEKEAEPASSGDDWGASSTESGWGASSTEEIASDSDSSWGSTPTDESGGWGDSSDDSQETTIAEADEVTQADIDGAADFDALLLKLEEKQVGSILRDGTPVKPEDEEGRVPVDATGVFTVTNYAENDRIWDIDVTFRETGQSTLETAYHVNELDPQESWTQEYDITDLPELLPLRFREVIDTVPSTEDPTNILVFGQTMETNISYVLTAEKLMEEIIFTKTLPEHFTEVTVRDKSHGKVSVEEGQLVWTVEKLEKGQEATLSLTTLIKVNDTAVKRTGEASLKYTSYDEGAFSNVDLEGADGLVRNFSFVESDEKEDEPDNWTCRLVLKNPSELPIELREISITKDGESYLQLDYQPGEEILPAHQEWTSDEWTLFSEDIPSFEKNVVFTVKPKITYIANANLDVIEDEMRVANLLASKSYGRETVPSYRETRVPTSLEVSNIGSLGFQTLMIRETIPTKFRPSTEDEVKVFVNEEQLSSSEYSISYEEGKVEGPEKSEEEDKSSTNEVEDAPITEEDPELPTQVMVARIDREIGPDDKIRIDYIPTAVMPEPRRIFSGQAEVTAELVEPGPPLVRLVDDWLSSDTVTVVHARKAVTIGKTVLPGADPGVYEINLTFINRGGADLEDIKIRDIIPEGFDLLDDSFGDLAEDSSAPEGKLRTWTFEKIEQDKTINILYHIQGEGEEYKAGKAQYTIS